MSELVATSTAPRRFQTLLLAALGIYGTLSYSVNQRYREIGIRLALGAQGRDVGGLVLRQALTPVAAGLALFLMRMLSALRFAANDVARALCRHPGEAEPELAMRRHEQWSISGVSGGMNPERAGKSAGASGKVPAPQAHLKHQRYTRWFMESVDAAR